LLPHLGRQLLCYTSSTFTKGCGAIILFHQNFSNFTEVAAVLFCLLPQVDGWATFSVPPHVGVYIKELRMVSMRGCILLEPNKEGQEKGNIYNGTLGHKVSRAYGLLEKLSLIAWNL
jgi:hypothetical protein